MSESICCVRSCLVRLGEGVPLHRFPNPCKNSERFQLWMQRAGEDNRHLTDNYIFKNRRICHKHFEQVYHCSKGRLLKSAVPSLFLTDLPVHEPIVFPPGNDNIVQLSVDLPTTSSQTSHGDKKSLCPRDNILKKQITTLRQKLKRNINVKNHFKKQLFLAKKHAKDEAFRLLTGKLTRASKIFVQMQIKQSGKCAKGRRFSLKEKILALSLYKASPKAYRLLSRICIMPMRKTLQDLLAKVFLKPGINDIIFEELKKKVSKMPKHHRYCSLIFDEMALCANLTYSPKSDCIFGFTDNGKERKPVFCDHVLVFMVRGVVKKFKQPVSYTFCASTTKSPDLMSQIKDVILKLQQTGLQVVSTVCDQGATNLAAIKNLINYTHAKYLRENKEWNGGFYEVGSSKIIPIFDPPHLIKGIRNNMLTKDLIYIYKNESCVAKWQHIVDLYKRGPGFRGVRLVPKLTAHHVMPNLIPKMRVKNCTQVFSRSVGVALGFMAEASKLPQESTQTAEILMFFDRLFDSVNGSSSKIEGGKIYRTAVTPTSAHHKLWNDSLKILHTMKYVDNTGKTSVIPSISSWIKTIEGFKVLVKYFHKEKIYSILLRNFNQDPLENFFGAIRAHGQQNTMPNAAAFQSAYKTLLINNISSPHSVGANCERDELSSLKTLKYYLTRNIVTNKNINITHTIHDEHLNIPDICVNNLIMSTSCVDKERCAALGYCSGWLVMSAKKRIIKGCHECKIDVETGDIEDFHKYIKISEYCNNKYWLSYPTKAIFEFFVQTENIKITVLKTCADREHLLDYIKLIVTLNLNRLDFLKCKTHKEELLDFLLNKCIVFNIYNWCKEVNSIIIGKQLLFDSADPIKTAAHNYYLKNKTRKRKRQA